MPKTRYGLKLIVEFVRQHVKHGGYMARDEEGKVIFDVEEQAVVDKIVQDRLARAKAEVPTDYNDLKEINAILDEFDFDMSPAERKAALKVQADNYKAQKAANQAQIDELEDKEERLTPAEKAKLERLEKVAEKLEADEKAAKAKADSDAAWNKQVEEFVTEYPDVDMDSLGKNETFLEFAEGSTLSLTKLYTKFVKIYGEAETEAILKVKSKESRSTSSGKGSSSDGGSYGLTEAQKNISKQAGMTFKEYADYLKQII